MQARIFLAWALTDGYDDDGQPRAGQKEALAIFQTVLKEDPDNRQRITTGFTPSKQVLTLSKPFTAQKSSAASLPPQGTWSTCRATSSIAPATTPARKNPLRRPCKADEQYMQTQHVQVDDDWNYVHNLMYAIANFWKPAN